MKILKSAQDATFGCCAEGVAGRFVTPAGEVIYLQTRARLKRGDTSRAGRLTSLLTPAREALDVSKMDFNQLLQRDLDDHRIAHELVPYILRTPVQALGPAFFPPIVAALLPFQDRQPVEELPELTVDDEASDPEYEDLPWRFTSCGDVFRLQETLDQGGQLEPGGQALLRWNDERAKLVILDGQHRAMAMLAVHRTRTNSWSAGASASERYRPFYETKVRELLDKVKCDGGASTIDDLEFPVTLCLFPEQTGPGRNPHAAARKLFVDINKEARPPSQSRLVLLSDTRLDHILARELLNHLRSSDGVASLPLYTVEYDNPKPQTSTPRRWNAVTNLEILLMAVRFCCFGPEELIQDIACPAKKKRGPLPTQVMGSYFRDQMQLGDRLRANIDDGPRDLERQKIGVHHFPLYNLDARKTILDRFFELWGKGFLRLFSEVEPYRAHVEAARSILTKWGPGAEVTGALAREALFEGVGMFWTLEQGHNHWEERVKEARVNQSAPPTQTDVSRAWEIVDVQKRGEFSTERCRLYLGKTTPKNIAASNGFFDVAITYAAQVGLALTWATLRHHNSDASPDDILEAMIECINRAITTGPVQSRDRRLMFYQAGSGQDFNLLPKMNSSFASYFRVFWLELLLLEDNRERLQGAGVDIEKALELREQGRKFYFAKVVDKINNTLKQSEPEPKQRKSKAIAEATEALAKAYSHWLGHKPLDARSLVSNLMPVSSESTVVEVPEPQEQVDEEDEGDEEDAEDEMDTDEETEDNDES